MSATNDSPPDAEAQFKIGCELMRHHKETEALPHLQVAAELGHTKAKSMLGVALINSDLDPDYKWEAAFKWIKEAANEGDSAAMANRDAIQRKINNGGQGAMLIQYSW